VFATAADAVDAAVAVQLAIGDAQWPVPEPLRVRIGIHSGPAELRDGDYYGTAVNRAARIMSVAHGGQIVVSAASSELVRDTAVEVLCTSMPSPFVLCPIGVLEMAHREADVAVARAAAAEGIPFVFSNQASRPMEETASAMGDAPRWFQLYWSTSDDLVASLVSRAERCGCSAIVLTLDTTMLGWRIRDLDLAYLPFLRGKGIAQYTSDPVFVDALQETLRQAPPPSGRITLAALGTLWEMAGAYPGSRLASLRSGLARAAVRRIVETYSRPSLGWDDLAFLRGGPARSC
jgi:lactate 2-monooxygenase